MELSDMGTRTLKELLRTREVEIAKERDGLLWRLFVEVMGAEPGSAPKLREHRVRRVVEWQCRQCSRHNECDYSPDPLRGQEVACSECGARFSV